MESKIKNLIRSGIGREFQEIVPEASSIKKEAILDRVPIKNSDIALSKRIEEYCKKVYSSSPYMWISGDTIERLSQKAGYKASTGSRRARELADDGVLECRDSIHGYVEYRYHPFKATLDKLQMKYDGEINL